MVLHPKLEISFYSLAIDKSMDSKDTAQVAIFGRGVNESFDVARTICRGPT